MYLFRMSLNKAYGYLQFAIKNRGETERPPTMLKRGYYVKEGGLTRTMLKTLLY